METSEPGGDVKEHNVEVHRREFEHPRHRRVLPLPAGSTEAGKPSLVRVCVNPLPVQFAGVPLEKAGK